MIYSENDLHDFCQCYLHAIIMKAAYLGSRDDVRAFITSMPCYLGLIFEMQEDKRIAARPLFLTAKQSLYVCREKASHVLPGQNLFSFFVSF